MVAVNKRPQLMVFLILAAFAMTARCSSTLWPLPSSVSLGNSRAYLAQGFSFSQVSANSAQQSAILDRAFARYLALIGPIQPTESAQEGVVISSCAFKVDSISTADQEAGTLLLNVDESYSLSIASSGECSAHAATIWGALHALETFSQLLVSDPATATTGNGRVVSTPYAPSTIEDVPRFAHRGLLIDTSRHFLPTATIKNTIDALSMNKFNVLHWHMVDAQSFPLDSPSSPKIVKGAYSSSLTYSLKDVQEINSYASDRGIKVIYEIDVPGHAASWNAGYPSVMADCLVKYSYNINDFALDPTIDETYDVLRGILADIVQAASSPQYLHLGGDEVVYGCWANDSAIVNYMAKNNIPSYAALLGQFVKRADAIVNDLGANVIHWEEIFTAGAPVPKGTIFQVWTNASSTSTITAAKYPVIASPSSYWYLDHTDNTWQKMYAYDPAVGLSTAQQEYLIGGEVAMWGEHVDENNFAAFVFPRAFAVGERLWSPSTVTDPTDALNRLVTQVCRMVKRGIHSSPLQPGYCADVFV